MQSSRESSDEAQPQSASDASATGLPVLRNWPAVYLLVGGVFVLYVLLLTALTRAFS